MGNITGKQVGDFQAQVGRKDADINVAVAWGVGVVLLLTAVVMTIIALIPRKPIDCPDDVNDANDQVKILCDGGILQDECKDAKQDLAKAQKHCATKEKTLWLLWGLLLIPLAALIIFLARWWQRETRHSRSVAQLGGAVTEVGLARDLFRN